MKVHNRSPTEKDLHKNEQCRHTFEITTNGVHRAVAMIRTVNVTKKPRVLLIQKHLRYE